MTHVVLSLGSNIKRQENIRFALQEIAAAYGDIELSPIYETQSIGFKGEPFLNLVAGINTGDSLREVQLTLRSIEQRAGRVRGKKSFDNRILDIDIILYGNGNYRNQGINVPRDEIECYAYVLKPLSDLYPEMFHPLSGVAFKTMWSGFDQPGQSLEKFAGLEDC